MFQISNVDLLMTTLRSSATAFPEKGIILLEFHRESCTLDVQEVAEGWEKALQLSPERKQNVLVVTGRWSLLDKEARSFVTTEFKKWPHVAVVIDNTGQRIMGTVVLNLIGKSGHIKLFENRDKAQEWLESKNIS